MFSTDHAPEESLGGSNWEGVFAVNDFPTAGGPAAMIGGAANWVEVDVGDLRSVSVWFYAR